MTSRVDLCDTSRASGGYRESFISSKKWHNLMSLCHSSKHRQR
jgi:hypothetical protein